MRTIVLLLAAGMALPLRALTPWPPLAEREGETAGSQVAGEDAPAATFHATAIVRERPLASATAAVTVLDREEIERSGARTAADLLRFAPGVDVAGNGARGGFATAQIRGGEPNFTLVLLDGVPLNDATYQVGDAFNLEGLPAAAVERIEIVRGPLSSFYGSTGLAGAINIVTRQGKEGPLTPEVEAGAGDASLRWGSAALSGGAGRGAWFVGLSWEEEAERIADERFEQLGAYGNLALPLGSQARLELRTRHAAWEGEDYPDASGGPVLGSGELRRSEHEESSLGAEVRLEGARPQRLTAAFYRHEMDRRSPAVFPVVPPSVEATTFTRARLGWAATLLASGTFHWTAGADVQREEGENESLLLLPPEFGGELPGDYAIARTLPGAYTELALTRGGLVVEIGSRLDLPEDGGAQWSPRLGASWRPREGPLRLHASAGRAFKLPSFFALASPPQLGGNPDLRPEKALGGDVGAAWELGRGEAGVTLFYNRYEDLIDFDFETFTHLNRSEVETRGIEATLAWRFTDRLSIQGNGAWQEIEDLVTDARLRHRPRRVGGARLLWQPDGRLDLQLDAQLVSRRFDQQIPAPGRDTVPGYERLGLTASWRFAESWRLRARVDNLTDEDYEEMIGFPGAGRSLRVGLRYGK